MEPSRFDTLTRSLLVSGSRRRLLAGLLGGLLLRGKAESARAQVINCGCGTSTCLMDPNGDFRGCCGGGACANRDGFLVACCGADGLCCDGVCCGAGQFCVGPGQCANACPAGTGACGRTCCAAGLECHGSTCTLPPPPPPPPCNGITCNGDCCGAGVGCDISGGCAAPCEAPLFSCKGNCMLTCAPGTLNADTCACECAGPICGSICCGAGQECASDGLLTGEPRCCPQGKSCGGDCKGDPGIVCCKAGPSGTGSACNSKTQTCCGDGCCPKRTGRCVGGKCKKRKK